MRPPLVVFDLDGTLVESHRAIVAALAGAVAERGHPPLASGAGADLIGLPLTEMFPRLVVAPLHPDEVEALGAAYRALYPALAAEHERVFAGVHEALATLRAGGATLTVATSKSTSGAEAALSRHGLRAAFHSVLGFDAVARPKPAPDMVLALQARHPASRVTVVGDTAYDMAMGRAAGARCVGVSWGMHPPEALREAGADAVVSEVAALVDAVG